MIAGPSPVTRIWRTALLASVAGLFAIAQFAPAAAQSRDPGVRKANSKSNVSSSKKDTPIRHPFGENMPSGPLQMMISLNDQRAVLYSNGVRVAETKVSTGTPGHPTPTGVFSVIQKDRWHRSNIHGAAPMFFMHRLTWSGIALHEGVLPGFAASHGCIRMPTDFVSRLWNVTKLGMRVVVARVELTPQDFAHPKLFNPLPKPVDTSRTSEIPDVLRPSFETTGQGLVQVAQATTTGGDAVVVTDAQDVAAGADVVLSGRHDGPIAGEAAISIAPSGPATQNAAVPEAIAPVAPPVTSDVAVTPVVAEPVTTSSVTEQPASEPAAEASRVGPAVAEPATERTEPPRPAIDPDELRVPRPAPLRARSAEPVKLNGQVAVFISGKEKRIFVRQAFVPLFDMPIEIANPTRPLGTHTYTALELVDGGARMRWNVVSMPLTAGHAAPAPAASGKKGNAPQQRPKAVRGAVVTTESSNASDALDRVNIPPEAAERIAALLTPGSSLIISDEGLGRETGRYTEFIVETR